MDKQMTSKILGFNALKNGPPFGPFSREEIKIAHLLPEQSAHQDDHFLQTWSILSGALDKNFFSILKITILSKETF